MPPSEGSRLLPVALISAAVLAYEVLLMRLFSILQWHHFAYMIISIALLGFGASGAFITLAQRWLVERYAVSFAASAALFGITALASFAIVERLPFNALEIIWDPRQLGWLAAELCSSDPAILLWRDLHWSGFLPPPRTDWRVYAFDLVGAGIGALGIVGLLFLVFPSTALHMVAALGFAAAAFAAMGMVPRWLAAGGLRAGSGFCCGVVAAGPGRLPSRICRSTRACPWPWRFPNARVIEERSSPLGLLTVVESPTVPFRHAPGLSLANTQEPPEQLAVFTDGDSIAAITAYRGRSG